MKPSKISLIAAMIAGVLLAYNPAVQAEEGKEGKAAKPHHAGPGGPGGPAMKEHFDKMAEDLKLTAEQKTKVQAAFNEQREKMRGMRDLSPDERREKMKASHEEMTKKMKEILTAEQFEKWQKHRPARPGGFGDRPPGAKKGGDEKK